MSLEGSYEQIDKRLSTLETRVENGFNEMRTEIRQTRTELDTKIDGRFNLLTLVTVLIGLILGVLQVLAALDVL